MTISLSSPSMAYFGSNRKRTAATIAGIGAGATGTTIGVQELRENPTLQNIQLTALKVETPDGQYGVPKVNGGDAAGFALTAVALTVALLIGKVLGKRSGSPVKPASSQGGGHA